MDRCDDLQNQYVAGKKAPPLANKLDQAAELAKILLEAIPTDRKTLWAYKVIIYIAQETMRRAAKKEDVRRISTKDIHTDLGGNKNQEPSAWLSPLWTDITKRFYPEIEQSVIGRCRDAGLNVYPTLGKSQSKPAYYWVETKELPFVEPQQENIVSISTLPPSALRYQPDLALKLSRRGKFLFKGGMEWSNGKRYGMVAWQLVVLLLTALLTWSAWVVLGSSTRPVSGQDLLVFMFSIAVPLLALRYFGKTWQLFEDRIAIAPDWMLAWTEFGATVEISRSKETLRPSSIHVRRYTAQCPICGAMIKLNSGDPEFPRRIVGRCEESPREHVFSFDRMTLVGEALRRPPTEIVRN